jgi:hypothetical protein
LAVNNVWITKYAKKLAAVASTMSLGSGVRIGLGIEIVLSAPIRTKATIIAAALRIAPSVRMVLGSLAPENRKIALNASSVHRT